MTGTRFRGLRPSGGKLVLVFLALEVMLAMAVWTAFGHESRHLLGVYRGQLEQSYQEVVSGYGRLLDVVNSQSVDVPVVRDLLAEADQATEQEQRALRSRLYRQLAPLYDRLRDLDLRVMQFVLPDGRSFLRFNRPDLFGDEIAAVRPVLAEVISHKRPAQGFENGRVYPGYRFAYPLLHHGQLVGVVDYSLSFDALRQAVNGLGEFGSDASEAPRHAAHRLLFRRDLIQGITDASAMGLFKRVELHSAYLVEDETSPLRDANVYRPHHAWVERLDRRLAASHQIQVALDSGAPVARYACLGFNGCWAVVVMPVRDSQGRVAAAFVSYADSPEYLSQRESFLVLFLLMSAVLVALLLIARHWLVSRESLRTVADHMGEGLYVMDRNGLIIYANQAASDLLGFPREQLMRQSAHQLFHEHIGVEGGWGSSCPLQEVPLGGEVLRSDEEVFRTRAGEKLPVSVVASPLNVNGELSGSIVLFRDLRAERAAKEKLQTADIAFRNLAEGVCVTDNLPRIKAVNEAFVRITGYREEEVLGKNPSLLSAGRHDRAFYEAFWRDLLRDGCWTGEIWNRRKSGEVFPELLRINAVHNERGAIVGFVSVFSDVSELRAKEARLSNLAYFDQVTGLYNRHAFMEMLEGVVQQSEDTDEQFALLLCDIRSLQAGQ